MANSLYHTRPRESVLACVKESAGEHMTAQQIADRLRANGEKIGLTTVYRCLDKLVGDGVLVKYAAADGESACFRLAGCGSENCFHVKCESCGAFFHLTCDHLSEVAAHMLDDHDFTVDPYKTVFYGTCGECRRRQSK